MKVKLTKAHKPEGDEKELPEGSVLECDEEAGKALIKAEKAVAYDDKEAKDEQEKAVKGLRDQLATQSKELEIAKKSLALAEQEKNYMSIQIKDKKIDNTPDHIKKLRDDEHLVGKAFQFMAAKALMGDSERVRDLIAKKAIAGMSEGTAADGGDLVVEAISRIMGQIAVESEFVGACGQQTLPDQSNSMKVVYDASDWWNPSAAPIGTVATEGASLSPTKLQFGAIDVYPRVPNIMTVVTAELLEDVAGLDGAVTRMMNMKLPKIIEGMSFTGTGANGALGFAGILDSTSLAQVSVQSIASLAAPTVIELQGFIAKIVPAWRKNSKWYMSNALWQTLQGASTLISAANIGLQLINLEKQTLLGYPVVVIEALPASTPIVFGDARQYALVNGRGGQIMLFSREAYFTSNQLAWRLTKRIGGCVAANKYVLADSSTVAAFCKYSNTGS